MAQRFVHALDYSDWHAQNIFSKHAKKRPLGLIENKYHYTLPQPVLCETTVDIDLTGRCTYRPKSTADIITEQHNSIHKLFNKARNISSAPQKRTTSAKSTSKNHINIEVKGRPLTCVGRTEQICKKSDKSKRPKTGNQQCGKSSSGLFMVLKVDSELLKSSRNQRNITQQIHDQWGTKNHDLSEGTYVRGKKRPQTVPARTNTWLTFGGSQGDASGGVIDAFASWRNSDQYYSIDGSVGSHVAQQLQRGDKIRIGINGVVQSHDLRIKSGKKEEQENETEQKEHEQKDEFAFSFEDEQNSLSNLMSNLMEEEPCQSTRAPLSWTDQIQQTEVKILSPRIPCETLRPNMSETHPVIFEKLTGVVTPAHRTWATRTEGYKVKHRLKSDMFSSDKKDHRSNRIKVVSIDHRSREEEEELNTVSVDEVLRLALDKRKDSQEIKMTQMVNKEKKLETVSGVTGVKNSKTNSHAPGNEVISGGEQLSKPVQTSVPGLPKDLSIVTPGARIKAFNEMAVFRRTTTKPPKGHRVGFAGVGQHLPWNISNETEYIKISSQIGNFKQISSSSYQQSNHVEHPPHGKIGGFAMDVPLMHSPFGPHTTFVEKNEEFSFMPEKEVGGGQPSLASTPSRSPPPSFQISIPTGDDASDGDSQQPFSPQRKASLAEEERDGVTGDQKKDATYTHIVKQVEQITALLDESQVDEHPVQTVVVKDNSDGDNNEAGDDNNEAGDDTNETGDDTNEAGDDNNEAGDDTNEAGDDNNEAGDNTNEAGDDNNEAGDDNNEAGDDNNEAGDDNNSDHSKDTER